MRLLIKMDTTELLLHPVRLRIVHATFDGEPFTITQLRHRMPDVSKATMYRQIALLVDNGLIEIDGEERKAEFDVYIADNEANPTADMVTYRQAGLWLSDNEKRALYDDLVAAIRPLLTNRPAPDRRRHLLATILFPQHGNQDQQS
jgi:DNA-binding transcriptional ArsR family regulator